MSQQDHEDNKPSLLRSIPKQFPVRTRVERAPTVHLPASTDIIDSRALHRLFTTSEMCMHEELPLTPPHRAIMAPRGSLDRDFSFHSKSPGKRQEGQIERLTNHIRQKLSESRLSKVSSKAERELPRTGKDLVGSPDPAQDEVAILLPASQRSTGLSDLLISQVGSDDGYDSDARSIRTPMIKSNADTLRVSPEHLQSQNLSIPEVSATRGQRTVTPMSIRTRAKSSPYPTTPEKMTFAQALQVTDAESPVEVLHRLSSGIALGTIKLPSTPELLALKLPSLNEVETEWKSSIPTPETKSILLTDGDNHSRLSLMSSIDPSLQDCLIKLAEIRSVIGSPIISSPLTAIESTELDLVHKTTEFLPQKESILVSETQPATDTTSNAGSERPSLHLFDMRISQRLASHSLAPVVLPRSSLSVSKLSLELSRSARDIVQKRNASKGRLSASKVNHNPSTTNQQTVPSFKEEGAHGETIRSAEVKPTFVATHTQPSDSQSHIERRNTSSSCYLSDEDTARDRGRPSISTRKSSIKNPNSWAIGGRSASESFTHKATIVGTGNGLLPSQNKRLGTPSNAHRQTLSDSWAPVQLPSARGRSFSTPGETILAGMNGSSSVMTGFNGIKDQTGLPAKDISNAPGPCHQKDRFDLLTGRVEALPADMWASGGRRSGWGFEFVSATAENLDTQNVSATESVKHLQQSTTDMWGRAFQMAQEDPTPSGLFASSRFDREGRRKPSAKSIDDVSGVKLTVTSLNRPRSQSAEAGPRNELMIDQTSTNQKLKARKSLFDFKTDRNRLEIAKEKTKLHVKNMVNIGSFATTPRMRTKHGDDRRSGDSTPIRDIFGIWGSLPSHTRDKRNGPAREVDGVIPRDFLSDKGHDKFEPQFVSSTADISSLTLALPNTPRWKLLSRKVGRIDKDKTKSMSFVISPTERARKARKRIIVKWRRLYRAQSSEFRGRYISGGHRSSTSIGRAAEYPELECLPGEGLFGNSELDERFDKSAIALDGFVDSTRGVSGSTTSSIKDVRQSEKYQGVPEWSKLYEECVGSLSRLRSEPSVWEAVTCGQTEKSEAEQATNGCSDMRESMLDFSSILQRQNSQARNSVLERVRAIDSVSGVVDMAKGKMKMPGGFEDD